MGKKYIACLGSGSDAIGSKMYRKMVRVGELLVTKDCIVVTGGFGGSGMEAPTMGARSKDGKTIGYIFNKKPANPYIHTIIDCAEIFQMIDGNVLTVEKQYGLRLGSLLEADGFIITDNDDTPGALVEFCAILNLQKKIWKKPKQIAIMVSEWGDLKLMELIMNKFFPNNTFVLATVSPEQAVGWVTV